MFETSKDVLYLVVAFCILWFTVFLCWTLYYVVRILKNANEIVEEFRARLQILTDAINYVRGKVENISALMSGVAGGVGGAVKNMVSRKAKEWVSGGTEKFNQAAKDAVDKAVEATAKKMKKVARKMR
jgi:uncharacterized protein YoxC